MGTLKVQAVDHREELKITALHHGTLHSEMKNAIGEHFQGINTSDKAYATFATKLDPEFEKAVKDAMAGYQNRAPGPVLQHIVIEQIKQTFGNEAAMLVEAPDYVQQVNRIIQELAAPYDLRDKELGQRILAARDNPRVKAIFAGRMMYDALMNPYDIRLQLLNELRAKFGERIVDLYLHSGTGDAVVSARGDIDPAHIAKAHEVAAKHDPDKAPPEPKSEIEQLKDEVKELRALVEKLTKDKKS